MKKKKNLILKSIVSILLICVIFWKVDKQTFIANFKLLDFRFIPLIIFLIILNYVVSSYRWKSLLIHKDSDRASWGYLTSLYFIGSFFNNFMPTSMGGDVFKIYALGRKIKNTPNALASTFMERFTGMIVLVLISYFGLIKTFDFWTFQLPMNISSNSTYMLIVKFLLFFGFWVACFFGFLLIKILSKKIEIIKKIYMAFIEYQGQYKVLTWAFITSIVVQLLAIFSQYFVYTALGVSLPLWHALFIFPVITLAGFFIPSLNGIGVQDALYMQLFLTVGVPVELSLSASVLYHLFRLSVSLIGGILYAMGKDN